MTNLKKIGLTALAGSLVAISAQAGEMTVTGSANITYKTQGGPTTNGPAAIGMDKDVAFNASGELDNGYTWKLTTLTKDDIGTVSSSFTTLTMGSLGTLTVNGINSGGGASKYDEEVPQAYEQTSDSQANSADPVGNQLDSGSLTYNSPQFEFQGGTVSFDFDYSPQADDAAIGDGGVGAESTVVGQGEGLGITASHSGLKIGAYGARMENKTPAMTLIEKQKEAFEGVWYAKYSMGPVTVGYSESYLDSGLVQTGEAATAVKAIRTASGIFESESMSIAFNVNDDFSVSYTSTDDTYDSQTLTVTDVTQTTNAIQAAYSMGAMSIKAYNMTTDNPGYDNDASDTSVSEIALGLAF